MIRDFRVAGALVEGTDWEPIALRSVGQAHIVPEIRAGRRSKQPVWKWRPGTLRNESTWRWVGASALRDTAGGVGGGGVERDGAGHSNVGLEFCWNVVTSF